MVKRLCDSVNESVRYDFVDKTNKTRNTYIADFNNSMEWMMDVVKNNFQKIFLASYSYMKDLTVWAGDTG